MFYKKQVVAAFVSLLVTYMPVHANQSDSKRTGPMLLLQQDMMLFENDIFVGRSEAGTNSSAMQQRGLGLSSTFSRWFNGIVPYQFHSSISPGGLEVARQAIEHWNEKSSITLVERDPDASDAPTDFVEFVKGPGCASWVGRQGQAQEIWVSDFCTAGSMIHEIGHALGLLHEHTRADRDQHIQVIWENIQEDKAFNFEVNTSGSSDLNGYDYNSIMHYGEYFFSANGERTMLPIDAPQDATIGQRNAASEGDLIAIDQMYGTDLSLSYELVPTGDTTEVTFRVSNLFDVGAHAVLLKLNSVETDGVVFSSDENVTCDVDAGSAQCKIDVVPGGGTTVFSVSLPEVVSEEFLNPLLSSKTHDINLSNNGLVAAASLQSEAIRSADSGNVISTASDASANGGGGTGAGAMHDKGLLVLLTLLLLRLLNPVLVWCLSLAFGAKNSFRNQYAFARIATSSRRTPR